MRQAVKNLTINLQIRHGGMEHASNLASFTPWHPKVPYCKCKACSPHFAWNIQCQEAHFLMSYTTIGGISQGQESNKTSEGGKLLHGHKASRPRLAINRSEEGNSIWNARQASENNVALFARPLPTSAIFRWCKFLFTFPYATLWFYTFNENMRKCENIGLLWW